MNIIVPVDFSAQSINAAAFASKMLTGTYGNTLVLYHMYQDENDEPTVMQHMQKLKEGLRNSSIVKITYTAEKGTKLVESLTRFLHKEDAGLVVMSVSDREKLFEDSYSLQMMSQSSCPVMVIPYGYMYDDVRRVALASDFKEVDKTVPLEKVKKILNLFRPQLHIVNVDPEIYVSLTEEALEQRTKLQEMFREYDPEFYFISTMGFHEALEQFIEDKKIDLVLTFPRKHSFLSSVIRGTNTKKLVYKNIIPVLAAHE